MRTKLFTLIAAIAFTFGATNVFAEGGETTKDPVKDPVKGDVKLKVEFHPFQTLSINGNDVALIYQTANDYAKGVYVTKDNQLKISSTQDYKVTVKAETNFATENTDITKLPLADIKIKATTDATDSGVTTQDSETNLSTIEQTIIEGSGGQVDLEFNVGYGAAGNSKYIKDGYVKDKVVIHNTLVTYTIAPN